MSKLEELIQELCPNGVEYKSFGDCAKIVRGASPRPIKNFITTEPDGVNWIKIGDVKPGEKYITSSAEKITLDGAKKSRPVKKGDFILSNSMSFGRPYILKIDGCVHDGWLAISEFSDSYVSDFLYYLLSSNMCQNQMKKKASFGGAVQNLNADIVRELSLPVPPLEVQKEIVRLLDDFTAKTAELQAELNKEYEARKKQYEYYRDQTLTKESLSTNICDKVDDVLQNINLMCSNLNIELHNDVDSRVKQIELYKSAIENYFDTGKILSLQQEDMENVIMLIQHLFGYIKLTLNEACLSIKDGMHNLPKNTSEVGDYPIISAQNINNDKIDYFAKRYVDIDTYEKENKRTNVTQNDVLLTIVATIGRTALVKEDRPILLQRSVCVLKPNSILRPSYLKHWLDTSNVQSYMQNNAHGSAQAGLYLKQVGAIEILIPSIEIQDKIVSALDNIRNISNNLQSKISSEIESRQKQYEFYRDKLLTFNKLGTL